MDNIYWISDELFMMWIGLINEQFVMNLTIQ